MHNNRESRIAELEEQLVETERQLIALHRGEELEDSQPPPPPPPPPLGAQPTTPPPPVPPFRPPASTPPPPSSPKPKADLVSAELLLRYGGISLVVASAIFFVSTAIARGWIGPTAQLTLATLTSLAMIGQSFRFSSEQRPWQITMAIGGTAALFVSGVIGYFGLGLLPFPVAVGWLLGSIGVFLALAIAHDAESIAIASLPAAFFGVGLLYLDELYQPWLLSAVGAVYIAAIAMSTFGRSWFVARASGAVLGAGIAGFGILEMISAQDSDLAIVLLSSVSIVAVLLVAVAQALEFRAHEASEFPSAAALLEARLAALTIPWVALVVGAVAEQLELSPLDVPWVIALTASVLGLAIAMLKPLPETMRLLHLGAAMATMATAFISVIDGPVLLMVLLGQTLLAGFLVHRFRSPDLTALTAVLGAGVALLTLQYLVVGTFEQGLTTAESIAVALVVIASVGMAWLFHSERSILWFGPWLLAMGWASATFRELPQGQMAVTLLWALIGASLMFVASRTLDRQFLTAGLATLAVTAGKLIFVDLIAVDVLWRAGLFFIVGSLFMRLAFVLPKLMDPPAAIDTPEPSAPDAPSGEFVGSGSGLS